MKSDLARVQPRIRAVASAVRRVVRGRPAKLAGLAAGTALMLWGLWTTAQRIDMPQAFSLLGISGLAGTVVLAGLINLLGGLAWSLIASAVFPGISIISATRMFFLTLPMKYVPGSVWSHVGRAGWLERTRSLPSPPEGLIKRSGLLVVAADFALLLSSGLVATLISGLSSMPAVFQGRVGPQFWNACLVLAICVFGATPFVFGSLIGRRGRGPLLVFARRIWTAQVVQIIDWLIGGFLLGVLVTALQAPLNRVVVLIGDSTLALYAGIMAGLAAIIVPNGLGIREMAMSVMYGDVAAVEAGFIAGFLYRALSMLTELLLFGLSALRGGRD